MNVCSFISLSHTHTIQHRWNINFFLNLNDQSRLFNMDIQPCLWNGFMSEWKRVYASDRAHCVYFYSCNLCKIKAALPAFNSKPNLGLISTVFTRIITCQVLVIITSSSEALVWLQSKKTDTWEGKCIGLTPSSVQLDGISILRRNSDVPGCPWDDSLLPKSLQRSMCRWPTTSA